MRDGGMQKILPIFNARRYCLLLAWVSLACGLEAFFSLPQISQAQTVTTDITASGLGTQVLPPNNHVYGITGGNPVDTNLFHSFAKFDVAPGDTAQFQTLTLTPNEAMHNILGRITDINPSMIFGTLDSSTYYPNANLFLMNPYGFLFGPDAIVNVGGMVAFTSSDYLKLTDNARFNAIPNAGADTLLTPLPVASFGFLGSNPGAITVRGSQFSVTDGQSISLVGGDISIESGTPDGGIAQPARLSAPNGNILLASAASPGEFAAATLQPLPNVDNASFTSYGAITLARGSSTDVSGTNTVSIRGGQFTLTVNNAALTTGTSPGAQDTVLLSRGSTLVTAASGDEAGADVKIVGTSVQLDGASITSLSTGAGSGGAISVTAEDTVSLTGRAQLVSRTEGTGEGGTVSVEATSSSGSVTISGFDLDGTGNGVVTPFLFNPLTGDPLVASGIYSLTSGSKLGGNISLTASTVSLQDGAVVTTVTSGDARGGNVSISSDTFEITSGASLLSSAGQDFTAPDFVVSGTGGGGNIIVTATDSVTISGGNLDLSILSSISTQTYNPVVDQALGQGQGGAISISAPNIILEDGALIASSTQGMGTGGAVNIFASNLSVSGFSQDLGVGSAITTSASGAPTGNGGTITISGASVTVENGGRITSEHSPGGNGGDLMVTVHDLTLRNGGSITSSGSGDGSSGLIQITATGALSISGQFFDPNNPGSGGWSVIHNRTEGGFSLNGGIDIHAGKLIMQDGPQYALTQDVGQIESGTGAAEGGMIRIIADDSISMSSGANIINQNGSFESGSITLTAPSITLSQSAIRGRTNIERDASAVTLNATAGNLTLSNDSHVLTSTLQSSGKAGPLVAEASDSIVLSGGSTIESSSSSIATGDGGAIMLTAGNQVSLSGTDTALKTTTSGLGDGGTILVKADTVNMNSGATITAASTGSGNAGTVTIQGLASPAQSVLIDGPGSGIFTDTQGTGTGGDIFVNAGLVTLQNGGMLEASTSGTNNGGDIQVDATSINLLTGAFINTISFLSDGSAGNITLKATQQITAIDAFLNSDAVGGTGLGGNILLRAPTVEVNGGVLSAATSGIGHAGNILLEGQQISLGASPIAIVQGADLFAGTSGSGHGGTVTIRGLDGPSSYADNVTISGVSGLHTFTFSDGDAGDITIKAAQFTLTDPGSRLSADSFGAGSAGTITITATDSATISNLARLSTDTGEFGGTGNAGQISVSAPTVMIENGGSISTNTTGEGTGGNINILAGQSVTMTNGSSISANSTGIGNAGNIDINAGQNFVATNSSVTTQANLASGGAIKITTTPSGTVELINSLISASVLNGAGGGGSVNIDPLYVLMQNSQILAQAVRGPGGNIIINITNGGLFLPDANSVISASSQFGTNGTVTIQSPNAPVSGQIQPLGKSPLPATSLLNQRCAALASGEFSSFTVAGRDSLPTEPGSWLASPLALATLSEGSGLGMKAEGGKAEGERLEMPILSLRQIAPAGFLTQAFAVDSSGACTS